MSDLFIANLTRQVVDFQYQLPEARAPRKQIIEIGSQINVSGDLSTIDIEAIIRQHAPYGLIHVSEIDRTKTFAGMCYSIGKPVNIDQLRRGLEGNLIVLSERGKVLRQEAAVAINNQMEDMVRQRTDVDFNGLEIEVKEQPAKQDPKDTEIDETIAVNRQAPPTPQTTTGRRSRRKAG